MYYTYLLRCCDGSLYAGITTDLARRMKEHRSGGALCAKYTRVHHPLCLCAAWKSETRSLASRLEYRLKRLKKEEKEFLAQKGDPGAVLGEWICNYRPLSKEELFQMWGQDE